MVIPVRQTIKGGTRHGRAGFTLIEVLVALFVMGVATTILFSMYSSSLTLASSSKRNTVATHVAEEYMNELRVHPELFDWPDLSDEPSGDLEPITLHDGENPLLLVSSSNAIASEEKAFKRDKNLYRDFGWFAYARLNEPNDNYVEVMVEIYWTDAGKEQNICLTSSVPRSIGEGVGK